MAAKLAIVSSALSAVLGVVALAGRSVRAPSPPETTSVPSRSDELSAELAGMRRELAALRAERAAPVSPPSAAASQEPRRRAATPRPVSAGEAQAALAMAAESAYHAESPDLRISAETAKKMESALGRSGSGVTMDSCDCGQSVCRMVFEHQEEGTQHGLATRLADADALDGEAVYVYETQAHPPRTTVYVALAGHHLFRER
jgi:hypothetical protein